jgi:type IX secretion system PorP/SprF family membrane protein
VGIDQLMTRNNLILICTLLSSFAAAQQTITYVQYTFNKAGMNPAASGSDIRQEYYYAFGINRQWLGFDNAPKQHFVNFSYTIRPPRSYRYWQNAGVYFENDDSGLLGYTGAYGNYTLHFLLKKKLVCSFGVYAGVRRFARSTQGFDNNDPAVRNSRASVLLYPDIIPGFRLSDNRFFLDLSVRQISVTNLRQFNGDRIGLNSKLPPSVFFAYGKKIPVNDHLLMIPSLAVNMPVISLPSADLTLMFYYFNRIGAGLAVRNTSFASAILQIRFLGNLTAGFAYSYPLNNTRFAAPNSFEFMMGMVPFGMSEKFTAKHSVSRCPNLSY